MQVRVDIACLANKQTGWGIDVGIYRLVRSANWKYAAGELALIIVGILSALYIDQWSNDRADSRSEARYLQALLEEATYNIERLQGNLGVIEVAHDSLMQARLLINTGDVSDDPVLLVSWLLRGSQGWVSPRFNTGVFDDLTSTGRLVLISDELVRQRIIDEYARIQTVLLRARDLRAEFNPGLTAVLSRYLPYEYFQWNGGLVSIDDRDRPAAMPPGPLDALLQDSQLGREITARLNAQILDISVLNGLEDNLESYRDYLAEVIDAEM